MKVWFKGVELSKEENWQLLVRLSARGQRSNALVLEPKEPAIERTPHQPSILVLP